MESETPNPEPPKYEPPMKIVVDTTFTKSSGNKGGVPMFSRVGRQTIAEDLNFQNKSSIQVQSTFEKMRQENIGKNKNENEAGDDLTDSSGDDQPKFEIADIIQQNAALNEKKSLQGGGITAPSSPTKTARKEKEDKMKQEIKQGPPQKSSRSMKNKASLMQGLIGNQKQTLQSIFEDLKAELQMKDKETKKKKGVLEPETIETIKQQQTHFKSNVQRFQGSAYLLNQRPISLNEGNYRINFEQVEVQVAVPSIAISNPHEARSRYPKIPPCVLNQPQCTLHSRKLAKVQNQVEFNSSLQIEENFFEERNMSKHLKPLFNKYRQKQMFINQNDSPSTRKKLSSLRNSKAIDQEKLKQLETKNSLSSSPLKQRQGESRSPVKTAERQKTNLSPTNAVIHISPDKRSMRPRVNLGSSLGADKFAQIEAGKPQTAAVGGGKSPQRGQRHNKAFSSTREDTYNANVNASRGGTSNHTQRILLNSSATYEGKRSAKFQGYPSMPQYSMHMRQNLKAPENLNNLYGSYSGFYSKSFKDAYNGVFKHFTPNRNMVVSGTTRERDNQLGKDGDPNSIHPNIHSPVHFDLQRRREIFHRRDGAMHSFAHEMRFVPFNATTTVCSKYRSTNAPQFETGLKVTHNALQEKTRLQNKNSQVYDAKFSLVHGNGMRGVPDFNRYITKEQRKEILGTAKSPNPYGYESVQSGFVSTRTQQGEIVPFKMLIPRDNLYQKLHGLPRLTKDEEEQQRKKYEKQVDYTEFLPNSILKCPSHKVHSHSYKTQMLNLSKTTRVITQLSLSQGKQTSTRNELSQHRAFTANFPSRQLRNSQGGENESQEVNEEPTTQVDSGSRAQGHSQQQTEFSELYKQMKAPPVNLSHGSLSHHLKMIGQPKGIN